MRSRHQLGRLMKSPKAGARRFFISSPLVWKLHGKTLSRAVPRTEVILLPDGERYKQLATIARAYDSLIKLEADRGATIIAVGGGVIGDMAGFIAATYLRGIGLIHVPTTLLAQVDSAIGGKVGVNHPLGKNAVGAFCHPAFVAADPVFIETLPGEFRAGLYEVIKYGMTSSRDLFDRISRDIDGVFSRKPDVLVPIIGEACSIKAAVVSEDERRRARAAMRTSATPPATRSKPSRNAADFAGEPSHAACSRPPGWKLWLVGRCLKADRAALARIIMQLGPLPPVGDLSTREVLEAVKRDKKVVDGTLHYVLCTKIGAWTTASDVTELELGRALRKIELPRNSVITRSLSLWFRQKHLVAHGSRGSDALPLCRRPPSAPARSCASRLRSARAWRHRPASRNRR